MVVVVVGIVAVVNFLGAHNQQEIDFTRDKIHAFSDQSEKVMQSLKSELKADFYGTSSARDHYQPLFENYARLSPQFKLEFIDPIKEPARTKAAEVKKMDTLMLSYQGRSIKLNDLNEEKVTNAIIKIEKERPSTVCLLVGHGEASTDDVTQNGMQSLKKALLDQSYVVNESSLSNGISPTCNSILMMGPRGKFFPAEIKTLAEYLNHGGRAVVSVEASLNKKDDISPEFHDLLSAWGVDVKAGLIVDPEAKKMGVDASLVTITQFNPGHTISKDYAQATYFPFARPIDFTATVPAGFKTASLAKSSAQAWAESDIQSFIKGNAEYNAGKDTMGPLSVAVATSGKIKDSKTNTRIVVLGSSQLVNNQYARLAGNLDFFMNAVSWVLEDESLISVRTKDLEQGRVEISEKDGTNLFWITIVVVPFAIALFGVLVWLQRKRL